MLAEKDFLGFARSGYLVVPGAVPGAPMTLGAFSDRSGFCLPNGRPKELWRPAAALVFSEHGALGLTSTEGERRP